jgi:UDP-N-acetylglucosamine transferase subunit ALG13
MIFLTVGTYPLPFDRLIAAIDLAIKDGLIEEEVVAQTGISNYVLKNMEYTKILEKELFDSFFKKASGIISHAGMGTITMALDNKKPLLVMPRRKHFKEHVNDHQIATARKFEELGHILVAYEAEELPEKIEQMKSFVPRKREAQPHVVAERIERFLNNLANDDR